MQTLHVKTPKWSPNGPEEQKHHPSTYQLEHKTRPNNKLQHIFLAHKRMKIPSAFPLLGTVLIVTVSSIVSAFQPQQPWSTTTTTTTRLASMTIDTNAIQVVDVKEKTPREFGPLEEWAAMCGVQRVDGFQLTPTPINTDYANVGSRGGVGNSGLLDVSVMTTQDLPANSPVLFVPNTMILSALQTQQEEFGQIYDAEQLLLRLNEGQHIGQFYLMVKILKEYEAGANSPWFPWLNSLPRYFPNGSSMTHFCCTQCLPPLVGKLASKERVRFSKFFQALKHAHIIGDKVKRNRSIVKWAFNVVYTRSFLTPNGDYKIVPMADMFNHGTETEIQYTYDEQGNCVVYTTRDVPAGSPLRMSYSDPTNPSFLFARYGFLDETSPSTFCKIIIDKPSQQLVDMGYDHSKMLFYKDTGEVSSQVWDVLLYQILGSIDPTQQQQFYQAHMTGDLTTKQSFHQHYYQQTHAALLNHVDTFLYQLDKLSTKAYKRMMGKKSSKHPRLPLILRHNNFVKETFLKVRSNLMSQ